jgi:hypothetical protein
MAFRIDDIIKSPWMGTLTREWSSRSVPENREKIAGSCDFPSLDVAQRLPSIKQAGNGPSVEGSLDCGSPSQARLLPGWLSLPTAIVGPVCLAPASRPRIPQAWRRVQARSLRVVGSAASSMGSARDHWAQASMAL